MMAGSIKIRVHLDGKEHGVRRWPVVPRMGEEICILADPTGKDEKVHVPILVTVWRVVWNRPADDFFPEDVDVSIDCSRVPPLPPTSLDANLPPHFQAMAMMRESLAWRGPSGKPLGHIVLPRELAQALIKRMVPDDRID